MATLQLATLRYARALAATCLGAALAALLATVVGFPVSEGGPAIVVPIVAGLLVAAGASRNSLAPRPATGRRVFFIGTDGQHADLVREAGHGGALHVVGRAPVGGARHPDPEALSREVVERGTGVLVLSDEAIRDERLVALAGRLNLMGLQVRDLRTFYEQRFRKVAVSELSPSWFLFDIAEIHAHRRYGRAKRAVELAVSALVLLATAPLLPLAALAIKLSSPGPVFFRQTRVGRGGRHFSLTKLRTMHERADAAPLWADECRERIFPVGRFLRKFRIDELPQLWNVLRGDLSLVGPRPEQPEIAARLEQSMRFYAARHSVRPGLTGWAQINEGYGGSDAETLTKLQYDLFYIKRQSLRLDLRIIAATARAVLSGSGR